VDFRRTRWMAAACVLALLASPAARPLSAADDDPATRPVRKAPGDAAGERVLSRDGAPFGGGWGRTILALAMVVALIFLARYLLRRLGSRGAAGGARPIEIVARVSLSARQQLVLVRLGGRLLLLGAGTDGIRTLTEITDPAAVAELTGGGSEAKPPPQAPRENETE